MKNKIKTLVISFGLFVLSVSSAMADKKEDYQKTYNYARAIELVNEGKNDEAISFLQKELQDHQDNGYAMVWLASLYYGQDQNGEALSLTNKSLKYLNKKEPFYASALILRSRIYRDLEEEDKAMDDLAHLVKAQPDNTQAYDERARIYINNDNYTKAEADFLKITQIDPSEVTGYVGLAVCQRNMERYDEALISIGKALRLNPQNANTLAHRALVYFYMKNYQDAAEDVLRSLELDGNDLAFNAMQQVSDSAFEIMDFKLKVQQMVQPTVDYWPYCRGIIHENVKKYKEAIPYYETSNKMNFSLYTCIRMSICAEKMGDYQLALDYAELGLTADSSDLQVCMQKADCLFELGRVDESIAEYSHVTELAPAYVGGYFQRGLVKFDIDDIDGAIEDFTMSILLNPSHPFIYLNRAHCYSLKGQKELARADYEEVIKRDTIPSGYTSAYCALLELGEREKAIAALDSVLSNDSTANAYNAACFYARMNEKEIAINYLKKAIEEGHYDFFHIEHDHDLLNIREEDAFKQLIETEKEAVSKRIGHSIATDLEDADNSDYVEKVMEIPFTHESGVTKVKCRINDLPLHFVFDTGAADVTISSVEATFMLKNGYLSEKDITGKALYTTADGSISEGTTIILRKVIFGDLELEDVKASVVMSQKAPLLLGQSVLQRLGRIEIDNGRNVLKVTQRVKK